MSFSFIAVGLRIKAATQLGSLSMEPIRYYYKQICGMCRLPVWLDADCSSIWSFTKIHEKFNRPSIYRGTRNLVWIQSQRWSTTIHKALEWGILIFWKLQPFQGNHDLRGCSWLDNGCHYRQEGLCFENSVHLLWNGTRELWSLPILLFHPNYKCPDRGYPSTRIGEEKCSGNWACPPQASLSLPGM